MSTDKDHSKQFEQYLKGQMSPEEAHAFEREVLDDPFALEALEGYEMQGKETIHDLKRLRSKVLARKKSFPFMRVAAAVALLVMGSFTVYFFIDQVENDQLAMEKESSEEMIQQPAPDTIRRSILENTPKEEAIEPTEEEVKKPRQVDEIPQREEKATEPEIPEEEGPVEEPNNQGAGMMADNEVQDDDDFMLAEADEVIAEEIAATEIELDEEAEVEEIAIEPDLGQDKAKKVAVASEAAKPLALRSRSAERSAITNSRTVSGIVTDDTGESLPGVNVLIKGTTTGTTSDLDGNFSLSIDDNTTLVFSFVGFESQEIQVGARNIIDVTMGGATELQEVVVTGYGGYNQSPSYSPAKPTTGNSEYKDYIETNLRYPEQATDNKIEGTVVLVLTINQSGAIADIETKKSLGYGCDEEAIRLVREGPDWEPAEKDGVKVEDKVRIRVKFKLE